MSGISRTSRIIIATPWEVKAAGSRAAIPTGDLDKGLSQFYTVIWHYHHPGGLMNRLAVLSLLASIPLVSGGGAPGLQEIKAQRQVPIAESIDRTVSQFIKGNEPGGAVIVVKDRKVIFRKAYGMASLELGVRMEPDFVFSVGSLTKQFTAVAAMRLVEQGRLSLTDYVGKYFPDFPGSKQVQIRHLLAHTSGIRDYIPLKDFHSRMREDLSNDDVLEIVKKEPLEFPPGEKFSYSNSNYALVGTIIEKVTGQRYEQFLRESVLIPLGLDHTQIINNTKVIPRSVNGYEFLDGEIRKAGMMSYSYLHAAGGMCTNIDDLAKWNNALFGGQIISRASLAECLTPQKLNSGESSGMGMGWFVDTLYGRRYVYHGGGIYGFVNHTLFLPEDNLYVAVLRNFINRSTDTRRITEEIAGIVLGESAPPETVSLSAEQLIRYVGVYRFDDGSVRRVMVIDGHLYYGSDEKRKVEIFPESLAKFHQPGGRVQIVFQFDDKGEVVSMDATAGEQSKTGIKQTRSD
jgi:D-alanyl-D-alanine carboxypeptidase